MKHFLILLPGFILLHLSAEAQHSIPQEVIKTTREFRERLLADPYRPAYHFSFPEGDGQPGDPNGAFYHDGLYHLMFLYNRTGEGFAWGHVSSADLLHWRYHPDAMRPGNGDEGSFSGGAFVDDDGSVILSYWMLWGAKGIGLAKSKDLNFNDWEKSVNNPVIKSSEWGITDMHDASGKQIHIGSADPSNIWKKDGRYYMLTGNLLVLRKYGSRGAGLPANIENGPGLPADSVNYQGDHAYLFVSDDLKEWKYLHEFYKGDRRWTNKTEDIMCPSFLPLPSGPDGGKPSGKDLLLFISHNMGCQYYVGDYKNNEFYPETHGRMTWRDNAYFAPEALVDGKGRQIMWSWIFDDRPDSVKQYYGWTGTYGLPRSLWIGKDGTLRMRPVKELESLRMKETSVSDIQVSSGAEVKLNEPGKALMELKIVFLPSAARQYGVKVCASGDGREETVIYYDQDDKKLKFDTRKSGLKFGRKIIEEAPLDLKAGEPLVLSVFIDKSIVEVFANDKQAIARMVYPSPGSTGISLFSENGNAKIKIVKAWELSPSNPY
ncbi:MAG: glycoside hydrolase family 32 protein [Bacteroidota bacterium]|nr:glycoside hydrolase family 32 protein [Bacteroidota bacterium]